MGRTLSFRHPKDSRPAFVGPASGRHLAVVHTLLVGSFVAQTAPCRSCRVRASPEKRRLTSANRSSPALPSAGAAGEVAAGPSPSAAAAGPSATNVNRTAKRARCIWKSGSQQPSSQQHGCPERQPHSGSCGGDRWSDFHELVPYWGVPQQGAQARRRATSRMGRSRASETMA